MSGDSSELEALFDSIAAGNPAAAPAGAPAASPAQAPVVQSAPATRDTAQLGDSDELQALFDSFSGDPPASDAREPVEEDWVGQEKVFRRVGHMARQLHDTLRELGYDKMIAKTVEALPDAKDRLAYIASLTEQAASKVLNATDVATPLLESLETDASGLAQRWDKVYANQMDVDDFKQLAADTRAFMKSQLPQKLGATKSQLTEIMMAQDFQDLTGQVIKKVVALAQELEAQLMGALIEVMPGERKTESVSSLLNGPVINAEGRSDVVVDQQQVDELLDSLGF